MDEESYKEWQEELRMEGMEERMDDRRFANRSAEEILEDIADDFMDTHGDVLEGAYNKLYSELSDYGLECTTDDIIEQALEDCTRFNSPYIADNRSLRKRMKILEQELSVYIGKFGVLDD